MPLIAPSGAVLTPSTVPTLLPSEEMTAMRSMGWAAPGVGEEPLVSVGGGVGVGLGRAAGGGALGDGRLGPWPWVCADAASHEAKASTTTAPNRGTILRWNIGLLLLCMAPVQQRCRPTAVPERTGKPGGLPKNSLFSLS